MGLFQSKRQSYFNPDGNYVIHHPSRSRKHNPTKELAFVNSHDDDRFAPGDECYLIHASWLESWMEFVKSSKNPPPSISNHVLCIVDTTNKSATIRPDITNKVDFRTVNRVVWEFLFKEYGGGPILMIYVPIGLDEKKYRNGSWVKAVELKEYLNLVIAVPTPVAMHKWVSAWNKKDEIAKSNLSAIGNSMLHDLGKHKMAEAKALDAEIAAANAGDIGSHMLHDLGKQKMAQARALDAELEKANADATAGIFGDQLSQKLLREAKELQEQENRAQMEAAANLFASAAAEQKLKEAREIEEQQNQAQMEAIANKMAEAAADLELKRAKEVEEQQHQAQMQAAANLFAGGAAEQKLKEAREADARAAQDRAENILESLRGMGAKSRFKQARVSGHLDVAKDAAASMLQAAWRGKLAFRKMMQEREKRDSLRRDGSAKKLQAAYRSRIARRQAAALKIEKQQLRENGSARKLQAAYRARMARRRAAELKLKKQRALEEAYARKLQCVYRTRLARRKAALLKAEKQRKLEEGYARKLQSAWRSKKARARVAALKAEKQRLQEEGSALMLQSAWRMKKSRAKVDALKAQRLRLREEGAALMLQSSWRIRKAKLRVSNLRQEKFEAEARLAEEIRLQEMQQAEEKRVNKAKSILFAALIRLSARIRLRAKIARTPQTVLVTLKSATDINIGDVTSSDPFVYVATVQTDGVSTPKTVSLYRSSYKNATLNPVWDETAMACNVTMSHAIVLTICDHDMVSANDFLGQVVLPMRRYMRVFSGETVHLSLDIDSFKVPVFDQAGKALKIDATDTPGKGRLNISLKMSPYHISQSGWVMKLSGGLTSFLTSTYKRRYFVLHDNSLEYFDDEFSLNSPRQRILPGDLSEISEKTDKAGKKTVTIHTRNVKDSWDIQWVDGESAQAVDTWMRKFRCLNREVQSERKGSVGSPGGGVIGGGSTKR